VDRGVIGGLSNLGDPLPAGVRAIFDRWDRTGSAFVASLKLADRVELATRDVPYAALGAALLGTESPRWK